MSIIEPRGTAPLSNPKKVLEKHLDICKKFLHGTNCTRISLMVTFTHNNRECNEILIYDGKDGLPVPKEELYKFFHSLGESLINQKLLTQSDEVEPKEKE